MRRTNHTSLRQTHPNMGGFAISFTEYAKEMTKSSPCHHIKKPRQEIPNHSTWAVSTSRLERSVQTPTVDTIYEVTKLAMKATGWARIPLKSMLRMDHSTRRHFARETACLHCKLRVVAKQRIKYVSWQDRQLQQKHKQQTTMMKLSTYACA